MFELHINRESAVTTFDHHLPIFNWPYPIDTQDDFVSDWRVAYVKRDPAVIRRRAIYIHVPFCETICNFCPFSKEQNTDVSDIDEYVDALTTEFALKEKLIGRCEVDAIFIGGGTPSLLQPRHIDLIGNTIARSFDLRTLREFTCEVEVKSVSKSKLLALRDIGVNRISFGSQTFSSKYRELFSLSASVNQVAEAAQLINGMFSYTNSDLLYGLPGQTLGELDSDLSSILELGTTTIDVYPINNLSASAAMHRAMRNANKEYLSASVRMQYRVHLEKALRALQYAPISGYGFARAGHGYRSEAGPVQHSPKFLYHDLVYGYDGDEILGYGSSAYSQMPGFNIYNYANRRKYVNELTINRTLPQISFGEISAPERGVVTFPFRGTLDKTRINWSLVPTETITALRDAIDAGLVVDNEDSYNLTGLGWLFYVNLMYYLMPQRGKSWLSTKIDGLEKKGRRCGDTRLDPTMRFEPVVA